MFLELCGWLALSEELFLQGALLLGGGVARTAVGQLFQSTDNFSAFDTCALMVLLLLLVAEYY